MKRRVRIALILVGCVIVISVTVYFTRDAISAHIGNAWANSFLYGGQ